MCYNFKCISVVCNAGLHSLDDPREERTSTTECCSRGSSLQSAVVEDLHYRVLELRFTAGLFTICTASHQCSVLPHARCSHLLHSTTPGSVSWRYTTSLVQHSTMQCSTVQHCSTAPRPGCAPPRRHQSAGGHCTVLFGTALNCTLLYCTALNCTLLYCTALYCTLLYCTVLH